jgi:hypothetical protein
VEIKDTQEKFELLKPEYSAVNKLSVRIDTLVQKETLIEKAKYNNIITPKANILTAPSNLSGYQTRRNYHPRDQRENKTQRNVW